MIDMTIVCIAVIKFIITTTILILIRNIVVN